MGGGQLTWELGSGQGPVTWLLPVTVLVCLHKWFFLLKAMDHPTLQVLHLYWRVHGGLVGATAGCDFFKYYNLSRSLDSESPRGVMGRGCYVGTLQGTGVGVDERLWLKNVPGGKGYTNIDSRYWPV